MGSSPAASSARYRFFQRRTLRCACRHGSAGTWGDQKEDALKEQDKFDEAAQRIAYSRALAAAKKALTQETITFIEETFGDLDCYLKPMIEAQVRSQKTYM